MAKARAIVKRRKAVQNIRKITRTMELIATARFKKALDRATEAEAYTRKIAELVADLGATSPDVSHPLLETRETGQERSLLLVLTSNRGLSGGYNGNVLRGRDRGPPGRPGRGRHDRRSRSPASAAITYFRFRGIAGRRHLHPVRGQAAVRRGRGRWPTATSACTSAGEIDRLDVAYTKFVSSARQTAVVETLLPMTAAQVGQAGPSVRQAKAAGAESAAPTPVERVPYEFLPDARSILEEIVPVSFKVRLFKCFLDAAVSEQIARMVAMKGATENADDMIKTLTRLYNRARQAQITRELAEIIGGAAALK